MVFSAFNVTPHIGKKREEILTFEKKMLYCYY